VLNWNKIPRTELIDYWKNRKVEIDYFLREFQYYQNFIERRINEENSEFEKFTTEIERTNLSEDTVEHYKNNLSNFFRKSFLVQIISMIENQLRTICELVEEYNFQKFSVHDLKGFSDLLKTKTYLTKTIEIDFNTLNPEWNFIQNCQGLRNIIVHHQGVFSEQDKKNLKTFIERHDSLVEIPQYYDPKKQKLYINFAITDEGFNKEFIQKTSLFFDKLFDYLYDMNRSN